MGPYKCPKCDRLSIAWDGRAKILMCYYVSCSHVVRIPGQKAIPSADQVLEALDQSNRQSG